MRIAGRNACGVQVLGWAHDGCWRNEGAGVVTEQGGEPKSERYRGYIVVTLVRIPWEEGLAASVTKDAITDL